MPLSSKGRKIKAAMKKTYGAKKGEKVFHASANKGTVKGVKKASTTNRGRTMSASRNKGQRGAQMSAGKRKGSKK